MTNTEKVFEYLDKAKVFYVSTVDGDKPKTRPFSFKMIVNDTLYFGVGTFKDCYKQMVKNPHVEIVASDTKGFMRFFGEAAFNDDPALFEELRRLQPGIAKMYEENHYTMAFFSLKNATAEMRSLFKVEESLSL